MVFNLIERKDNEDYENNCNFAVSIAINSYDNLFYIRINGGNELTLGGFVDLTTNLKGYTNIARSLEIFRSFIPENFIYAMERPNVYDFNLMFSKRYPGNGKRSGNVLFKASEVKEALMYLKEDLLKLREIFSQYESEIKTIVKQQQEEAKDIESLRQAFNGDWNKLEDYQLVSEGIITDQEKLGTYSSRLLLAVGNWFSFNDEIFQIKDIELADRIYVISGSLKVPIADVELLGPNDKTVSAAESGWLTSELSASDVQWEYAYVNNLLYIKHHTTKRLYELSTENLLDVNNVYLGKYYDRKVRKAEFTAATWRVYAGATSWLDLRISDAVESVRTTSACSSRMAEKLASPEALSIMVTPKIFARAANACDAGTIGTWQFIGFPLDPDYDYTENEEEWHSNSLTIGEFVCAIYTHTVDHAVESGIDREDALETVWERGSYITDADGGFSYIEQLISCFMSEGSDYSHIFSKYGGTNRNDRVQILDFIRKEKIGKGVATFIESYTKEFA